MKSKTRSSNLRPCGMAFIFDCHLDLTRDLRNHCTQKKCIFYSNMGKINLNLEIVCVEERKKNVSRFATKMETSSSKGRFGATLWRKSYFSSLYSVASTTCRNKQFLSTNYSDGNIPLNQYGQFNHHAALVHPTPLYLRIVFENSLCRF